MYEIAVLSMLYLQGMVITGFFWLWACSVVGEKFPDGLQWAAFLFWPIGALLLLFSGMRNPNN